MGPGGLTVELTSLRGAPGPLEQGLPQCAWLDISGGQRLLIEYRGRDPAGWDRGLPDPGPDAGGWLVFHRTPSVGPVMNLQVGTLRAAHGESRTLWPDNLPDIFSLGPVRVTVAGFNLALGTVVLHLSRRAARHAPSGVLFGGVEAGGGGLVWTPGGGFTPVPPHSPLIDILDHVAQLQVIQQLAAAHAGTPEAEGLRHAERRSLAALQDATRHLDRTFKRQPLAEAMESLRALQELARVVPSPGVHVRQADMTALLERLRESIGLIAADGR